MQNLEYKPWRPRKPKDFDDDPTYARIIEYDDGSEALVVADNVFLDAKACRKLAAWLERAADYLEYKNRK